MTGVQRVLLLGGYGAFGRLIAQQLTRVGGIEVVVAGRSHERAAQAAHAIAQASGTPVRSQVLDATSITAADITASGAKMLVHAAGPYQLQDYRVARACIAAGAHYVDLADASAFVTGIRTLDGAARAAEVLVVAGASTAPAVSGAVVDAYAPGFARLDMVETTIAPGNSFHPGLATTRSILASLGRPLGPPGTAIGTPVYGWQGLGRRSLPGLGKRWTAFCDAPDLALFPARYPGLASVRVNAALEVAAFHHGLWALSWLVRAGLVARPERWAAPLLALKRGLRSLGSDRGGMSVTLEGQGHDGSRKRIEWGLVAGSGHGPYIPATPSALLAKRLLAGTLRARGATPSVGLFTLQEFLAELAGLDVTVHAPQVISSGQASL